MLANEVGCGNCNGVVAANQVLEHCLAVRAGHTCARVVAVERYFSTVYGVFTVGDGNRERALLHLLKLHVVGDRSVLFAAHCHFVGYDIISVQAVDEMIRSFVHEVELVFAVFAGSGVHSVFFDCHIHSLKGVSFRVGHNAAHAVARGVHKY